jgi:hypothetical protein
MVSVAVSLLGSRGLVMVPPVSFPPSPRLLAKGSPLYQVSEAWVAVSELMSENVLAARQVFEGFLLQRPQE